MMRVVGLFVVLGIAIGAGVLYTQSTTFKAQDLPDSYKVLDDLEEQGLYAGEEIYLKDFSGNKVALSSLKGKVVILSFWATWCEPCVEEFPSFIKLMDTFPDDLVLVAISHDETEEDVNEFVKAFNGFRNNLVLSLDSNKALSKAFGVDRLPEGFVFNQEGKLVKKIIGIQDWASAGAIQFFKAMLSEPANANNSDTEKSS